MTINPLGACDNSLEGVCHIHSMEPFAEDRYQDAMEWKRPVYLNAEEGAYLSN